MVLGRKCSCRIFFSSVSIYTPRITWCNSIRSLFHSFYCFISFYCVDIFISSHCFIIFGRFSFGFGPEVLLKDLPQLCFRVHPAHYLSQVYQFSLILFQFSFISFQFSIFHISIQLYLIFQRSFIIFYYFIIVGRFGSGFGFGSDVLVQDILQLCLCVHPAHYLPIQLHLIGSIQFYLMIQFNLIEAGSIQFFFDVLVLVLG